MLGFGSSIEQCCVWFELYSVYGTVEGSTPPKKIAGILPFEIV